MKTIIKFQKTGLWIIIFSMITLSSIQAQNNDPGYKTYKGKTINKSTGETVVFASVYKIGTNIGTVSNVEGDFILKIPESLDTGKLGVSFIGYKAYEIEVSKIKGDFLTAELEPSPIPIKEVVVRTENASELIALARKKIPENYSMVPFMMTAFYREIIKQNRSYVGVSEAVLDVYKSSYINQFDFDRVKVYKGRKSMDVKRMDTVMFKLQGGPKTSFLLDIVKNPSGILSEEFTEYYDYRYEGVIEVDERQTYIISFDQKEDVPYSLYSGKIYLDASNLAISGVEFKLSEKGLDNAAEDYVRKRPFNMQVDILGASYLVNYREINGKWYFSNIRSELWINCKWDKKLFKSKYVTTLEMAVTNMDFEKVARFKYNESSGMSDVLADQVNYFDDTDFWGDYNTIKPEESIETAISKLNKKLVR